MIVAWFSTNNDRAEEIAELLVVQAALVIVSARNLATLDVTQAQYESKRCLDRTELTAILQSHLQVINFLSR